VFSGELHAVPAVSVPTYGTAPNSAAGMTRPGRSVGKMGGTPTCNALQTAETSDNYRTVE
jgi:hypothetical protein